MKREKNIDDFVKQTLLRVKQFKQYGFDIYVSRKFVVDKAEIGEGKILEIGTGKGFLALELARRGYRITSIDIDKKVQECAKAMVQHKGLEDRVHFKIMDCRSLNFKDQAFDYVVSVDFFHHLTGPVKCLNEMVRVTKRKLIISDLNKSGVELFKRIHADEGRIHDQTKISFSDMKERLKQKRFRVKIYRKGFHTLLIAKKG